MTQFFKVLLLTLCVTTFGFHRAEATPRSAVLIEKAAFHDGMRKLWEDHITWTRLYLVSELNDLPNKDATTKRLLQNQVDLGDAAKPFYGDAGGDKLTALLKEHILTAAELVAALKSNNKSKISESQTLWYKNADDIAVFLNAANPENWDLAHSQQMMKEHLDLTTEEVSAQLKGDWEADIAAYDKIHEQILKMADMLSDGIIKQFPDKFNK